jgi:hypothetical protein
MRGANVTSVMSLVLGAVVVARLLLACGDFAPRVGPLRDAAMAPDCGADNDQYVDAGSCGRGP